MEDREDFPDSYTKEVNPNFLQKAKSTFLTILLANSENYIRAYTVNSDRPTLEKSPYL